MGQDFSGSGFINLPGVAVQPDVVDCPFIKIKMQSNVRLAEWEC
jgi:hypothetical protein